MRLVNGVPTRATRSALTHVAFVCDKTWLQPLIPQWLLGNRATLLKRDMRALRAICPANVRLVRCRSRWVSRCVFTLIIKVLAEILAKHAPDMKPVLVLDTCRVHWHKSVLRECQRCGITLCFVPPGMTWLLQPLDTHCFSKYKRALRRRKAEEQSRQGSVKLDVGQVLAVICRCIGECFCGTRWSPAFDDVGFGSDQQSLGSTLRRVATKLQIPTPVPPSDSQETVSALLPKGALLKPTEILPLAALPENVEKLPVHELHTTALPWSTRLRSSSKRMLAEASATSGTASAEPPQPSAAKQCLAAASGAGEAKPAAKPVGVKFPGVAPEKS